jgi:hypothetical protein
MGPESKIDPTDENVNPIDDLPGVEWDQTAKAVLKTP